MYVLFSLYGFSANTIVIKAMLFYCFQVVQISAVKNNRLFERGFYFCEIRRSELRPFCQDSQEIGIFECLVVIFCKCETLFHFFR